MAHFIQEIVQHFCAVFGVVHFRVELDAVKAAGFITDGHIRAVGTVRHQRKTVGHFFHIVAVTHPGDAVFRQALEQLAGGGKIRFGFAILAGSGVRGGSDGTTQRPGHELAAVTDAQDRHAQMEHPGVYMRRGFFIHAVGAAGKNNTDRIICLDFFKGML